MNALTRSLTRSILVGLSAALLTGCSTPAPTPIPAPPPVPTPSPVPATRLVLSSDQWVIPTGQSETIRVSGVDAQGKTVGVTGTWTSDAPGVATVSADGRVSAHTVGSARVTFRAGSLSVSADVTVADLTAGVARVAAGAALSGPEPVNPHALPLPGARFTVNMTRAAAPTVGSVVTATDGPYFAGRVLAVDDAAQGVKVTLERVNLHEVFRQVDVHVSGQVRDGQVVGVTGASRAATNVLRYPVLRTQALAEKEFPLGPLTCVASADVVINPSSVEVKIQNILDFDMVLHDDESGKGRLRLKTSGQVSASLSGALKVGANFTGKIECKKADLVSVPIPVAGPVGFFISPIVNLGLTMSAGGAIAVGAVDLGFQGAAKANVDLGFEYIEGQGLTNLSTAGGSADLTPRLAYTGSPEATFKAEIFAGPTASLSVGNAVASAELLSLSAGPVLEADLAGADLQVADGTYSSGYNLRLQAKVEPGGTVGDLIKALVKNVSGEIKESSLAVTVEVPLSSAPTGSALADTRSYQPGDAVTVSATLDPANTHFLGLYNVQSVELYRLERSATGAGSARLVAQANAAPNQETFTLKWTADTEGKVEGELFLFVRSALLPFLPLEVSGVTPTDLKVTPETTHLVADRELELRAVGADGQPADVTWSATGGTVTPDGMFKSSAPGTFTVTATLKNGSARASAQVKVSTLVLRPEHLTLQAGQRIELRPLLDGEYVDPTRLRWVLTEGTVSPENILTATSKPGTHTVWLFVGDGNELFTTMKYTVKAPTLRVKVDFAAQQNMSTTTTSQWPPSYPETAISQATQMLKQHLWQGTLSGQAAVFAVDGAFRELSEVSGQVLERYNESLTTVSTSEGFCLEPIDERELNFQYVPASWGGTYQRTYELSTRYFSQAPPFRYRLVRAPDGQVQLELTLPHDLAEGSGQTTESTSLWGKRPGKTGYYDHTCHTPESPPGTTTPFNRSESFQEKTVVVPLPDFDTGQRWSVSFKASELGYLYVPEGEASGESGQITFTVELGSEP